MSMINNIQEEIIEEFAMLDGDMEMCNFYLMELGQKLPEISEELKTDDNIVKGCQSKVWLVPSFENDKMHFGADSNTAITKGLISLLVRILSNQTPQDVMEADLHFIEKIGMDRFIGTQRSNGFGSMIKQMKLYALAYQSKLNQV